MVPKYGNTVKIRANTVKFIAITVLKYGDTVNIKANTLIKYCNMANIWTSTAPNMALWSI